jgi:hypothetical protein
LPVEDLYLHEVPRQRHDDPSAYGNRAQEGKRRRFDEPFEVVSTPVIDTSGQKLHRSRTWFLTGLAVVFLRALPNLRYPLGRDQAIYSVIGQGILHGQLPYRDLWDIKPPGIYYIYAFVVKMFGPVMWSVGVVDVLWLLVISCGIFYFARRYVGSPAAALAMVFNASLHSQKDGYIHAAQAETFLMIWIFAAWFLLRSEADSSAQACSAVGSERFRRYKGVGRCLAAGISMGAAFWLKYTAVVFFPFLVLVPFWDFRRVDSALTAGDRPHSRGENVRLAPMLHLRVPGREWLVSLGIVAFGFLLAILGTIMYLWNLGAWPATKEAHFGILAHYGANAFHWSRTYLVWVLLAIKDLVGFWTEIAAALSLVIAWKRRELNLLAPIALLALAGFVSGAVQGRAYVYYYEVCYPFLAMLWGYLCVMTWEGFQHARQGFERRGWRLAAVTTWLLIAVLGFSLISEESIELLQQYRFFADWCQNPERSYAVYYWQHPLEKLDQQLRVIDFLRNHSSPQDTVFVWGFAPLINFLAQRRSPSRFFYDLPVRSTWGLKSWRPELVHTLETERPRYIIVERHDSVPAITGTVMDSEQSLRAYLPLAEILHQYRSAVNYADFEVFELKSNAESQTPSLKAHAVR